MKRASAILLTFVFMVAPFVLADNGSDKVISGMVSSLDRIESTLSVLYTDPHTGDQDEVVLRVTGDSELALGARSIPLSDIAQGDPVSVTYYKDDLGGLKIRSLSDLKGAGK
ncbi:MAG: hypothetical protein WC578_05265 [Candidatus Omnitrophota bacterium]|jgi:hypothetical protein